MFALLEKLVLMDLVINWMRNIALIILLIFVSGEGNAQSLLGTAGQTFITNGAIHSYSLGEPFVMNQVTASRINDVGYQHPDIPLQQLKVFIEGFYVGNGTMVSAVNPSDPFEEVADTITVSLVAADQLNTVLWSGKTVLYRNGMAGVYVSPDCLNKQVYLRVQHRNAIETWSKNQYYIRAVNSFDFTSAP
jgi:hypothetical protein